MVVKIELVIHSHLAGDVSDEVRGMMSIVVHGGGEGRTVGGGSTVEQADNVGEEVVGDFCTTLQVDGSLIVVSALMSCNTDSCHACATVHCI